MQKEIVLETVGFSVSFCRYRNGFQKIHQPFIKDMDISVREKEVVVVVGASGAGKSLLAHGILGALPYNAATTGQIYYRGEELTEKRRKEFRGKEIAFVPQNVSYLDPLMKIGPQIRKGKRDEKSKEKQRELLKRYGLSREIEDKYPFELSGGMIRRVLIAAALFEEPKLVVADEPTPGLDAGAVRKVLQHFREIADAGAGVLLITHDLEAAVEMADRIAVLYEGSVIEETDALNFKEDLLKHPYSKALWRAMPSRMRGAI